MRKIRYDRIIYLILMIALIIYAIVKITNKKPKDENNDIPPVEEVIVKKSPLEMSVSEFTLEGYFDGTILKENIATEEYMNNIIYAGDSVALYYTINKINKKAVWHQISINPYTAQTCSVYVNSVKEYDSFVTLFEENKPEVVIMTLGTNGVSTMDKDYFIEQYTKFLDNIIKASPNTRLIVQSIPPVPIERDNEGKALNNDKINKYNYYIAEMCQKLNIEFLFSANATKDSDGGCKTDYCTKDLHPSKLGNEALYQYTKNHIGKTTE